VPRAAEPPKLDGILDDQVWTQAPMPTGQWVLHNPNRAFGIRHSPFYVSAP
jgi:hypothetical protein